MQKPDLKSEGYMACPSGLKKLRFSNNVQGLQRADLEMALGDAWAPPEGQTDVGMQVPEAAELSSGTFIAPLACKLKKL